MDGGYITIPESAMFTTDSRWAIENHGVDPDIEIENEPAELLAGHDAQLEAAVALMLKELAAHPSGIPAPPQALPAYPENGIVAGQP
jgi:tricorn protease